MRFFGVLAAAALATALNPTSSLGQSGQPLGPEEQIEPYHKHHDTRHGHDHYYPDRGAIVRDLPRGTIGLSYAGVSYRYHDGVWYEPRGPAFMVVAPPIGLVVPSLPTFATALAARGGETYLYANQTYYRPRPDLGGYEVVNDPPESVSQLGSEMYVAPQSNTIPPAAPQVVHSQALPAAAQSSGPSSPAGPPIPVAVPVAAATAALPATALAASPVSASALPATGPASTPTGPASTPTVTPTVAAAATPPVASATPTPPVPTAPVSVATASTVPVPLPSASQPGSPAAPAKGPKIFLYPKNGQNADQQARDRYDCYRFAVAQSGFDPMRTPGSSSAIIEQQSDFERAQAACFDARGYASR